MAYIDQLAKRHAQALELYRGLAADRMDPEGVRQAALFQIAEIRLTEAEGLPSIDSKRERLEEQVIPAFEASLEPDPASVIAQQARIRIRQVRARHFADDRAAQRRLRLGAKLGIKYDSNVVTQADRATVQLSETSSLVSRLALDAAYRLGSGKWTIVPRMDADLTLHSRRTVPRVYQNDAILLAPAVSSRHEHRAVGGKPASGGIDYQFGYLLRDHTRVHAYDFYNRWHQLALSEQARFAPKSATNLRLGYKILSSHDRDYSAMTPSLSLSQSLVLTSGLALFGGLGAELLNAEAARNDLNTYRISLGATPPQWVRDFELRGSLGFQLFDTRGQRPQRGVERLLSPTVSATYQGFKSWEIDLEYGFQKRWSKDRANYAYKKHTVELAAAWRW